ncbi:alpha-lytic protease prodomain-containing protein [Actinokineospora sp. HUAS TT18]|uniref:alpha-lytic protease prodomain-containing protein n=1 Tax=Actinokineospora sp. HUAS TT18 TaxID=3447451 RepID=UPI003F521D88
MNRKITAAALAALSVAGLATALAVTPSAAAKPVSDLEAAMARDLHITPEQAQQRLAKERAATSTESALRGELGPAFAGAWLDSNSILTVAVTDSAKADKVRARGAVAVPAARSEAQLDGLKNKLDGNAKAAPKSVPGWYVDLPSNTVVVLSHAGGEAAAQAWAKSSGVDGVRVTASTESPKPLIDIIGGNAYTFGSGRCSIGFPVEGGFVTAGHCGRAGTATSNPSGSVVASSFPGNDYAWVRAAAGNTPRALVNRYPGTVPVAGSQEAPVGASVCRSGSTTGWHCGTIQQKNASVTYPEGTITGLTRTNVCAEPGDSGGSWLSGDQAQGVTSGGSGNCTSGGTIYFQPVNEILQVYGLRLVVTGTPPTSTTTPPTSTTSQPPGGTWAPYVTYATGAQVTYGGVRYAAWQGHTSQPGWEPPNVPALWRRL